MAVEAVDFIRWTSAQRHFGADAGGSGGAATLWDLARPHHPVLARAAGVCESPIYRLTWSQSCAHDLPMSWWSQLEHRFGMPKPPPAVRRARAFDLLWLRHAHSGTLGPAWIYDYGPGAVHHPVRDRGWWRCKSSRVPGPSGSASTTSSRRAGRRSGAHSSLTACPLARPCAHTDCRLRLSRSCRPSWGR